MRMGGLDMSKMPRTPNAKVSAAASAFSSIGEAEASTFEARSALQNVGRGL